MANVNSITTAKGEQFTHAHVASMARRDFGFHVLSGCDVHQAGTPGLSVVVDSGYISSGFATARKTVSGGTLTIATPDVSLPRMDVVYVDPNGTIGIYAGTPTAISPSTETDFKKMASPSPGTTIPNGVILSLVYVAAGATEILNASILDIASYGGFVTEAPTGTTTSGMVPQWSSTQKTLTTGLTVGTSASNLVQLDGSAKLPAVDGSQLTNVVRNICIYIDNQDDVIETGIKAKICIDYACTIQSVTLHGSPSGSIIIDIWKVGYASLPASVGNTITASAKPTISSGIKYQDSILTGWTKSISPGDWLYFNVDSCTTMTNCSVDLKVVTV
jgi:hypothetical protein